MSISELLLPELDEETKKTRTTLERVPADKKDFAPHTKSMPLGKLAPHVAQLAGFGLTILTTPELDFSKGSIKPLPFESPAQLVQAFEEGTAKVRAALQATSDDAWKENWKLSFQGKTIFEGQTIFGLPGDVFESHGPSSRAAWRLSSIERKTCARNLWTVCPMTPWGFKGWHPMLTKRSGNSDFGVSPAFQNRLGFCRLRDGGATASSLSSFRGVIAPGSLSARRTISSRS